MSQLRRFWIVNWIGPNNLTHDQIVWRIHIDNDTENRLIKRIAFFSSVVKIKIASMFVSKNVANSFGRCGDEAWNRKSVLFVVNMCKWCISMFFSRRFVLDKMRWTTWSKNADKLRTTNTFFDAKKKKQQGSNNNGTYTKWIKKYKMINCFILIV